MIDRATAEQFAEEILEAGRLVSRLHRIASSRLVPSVDPSALPACVYFYVADYGFSPMHYCEHDDSVKFAALEDGHGHDGGFHG